MKTQMVIVKLTVLLTLPMSAMSLTELSEVENVGKSHNPGANTRESRYMLSKMQLFFAVVQETHIHIYCRLSWISYVCKLYTNWFQVVTQVF